MPATLDINSSSSSSNMERDMPNTPPPNQQRVVQVVIQEDSRECPSQEVGEIGRDDFYRTGANERRGSGILQKQHVVHYRPFFNRVAGLRGRHHSKPNKPFRERRESNSFDSHDSDDDGSVVFRDPLPCKVHQQHQQYHQITKSDHFYNSPNKSSEEALAVETGDSGKAAGMLRNNTTTRLQNKRKTPSPAMGVEPAPVSIAPLGASSNDDMMDVDEEENQEIGNNVSDDDESANNSPPGHTRRVSLSPMSLSPISRCLADQFDSISIYHVNKPSRFKRRKTLDTTLFSPSNATNRN